MKSSVIKNLGFYILIKWFFIYFYFEKQTTQFYTDNKIWINYHPIENINQ